MSKVKRYTLINMHIGRGSMVSQANHALNELWKNFHTQKFTDKGNVLMNDWLEEPIEVILNGGRHIDLEIFFDEVKKIKDIPCAKFNESMEDLMGACTAVTMIASDRIVAMNNYARFNSFTYANAFEKLKALSAEELKFNDNTPPSESEAFVAWKLAFMQKV